MLKKFAPFVLAAVAAAAGVALFTVVAKKVPALKG